MNGLFARVIPEATAIMVILAATMTAAGIVQASSCVTLTTLEPQ